MFLIAYTLCPKFVIEFMYWSLEQWLPLARTLSCLIPKMSTADFGRSSSIAGYSLCHPQSCILNAIVNAEPDLHNLTICDLVIEGGLQTEIHSDPNNTRSFRSPANRGGVMFLGLKEGQKYHIDKFDCSKLYLIMAYLSVVRKTLKSSAMISMKTDPAWCPARNFSTTY
jgi:hypothetical protein